LRKLFGKAQKNDSRKIGTCGNMEIVFDELFEGMNVERRTDSSSAVIKAF